MSKTIRILDGVRREIAIDEIEYLAGSQNYSFIHLKGGKVILVSFTLKKMAERLPDFIRIHKAVLVNPRYIVSCEFPERTSGFVSLTKGRRFPIARRRIPYMQSLCKSSSSPQN